MDNVMDYSHEDLLELAYELLAVDEEAAIMIYETLSDRQFTIILQMQKEIKQKWSTDHAC
jgi:hypothetical protein